jgi:hypothetical protein
MDTSKLPTASISPGVILMQPPKGRAEWERVYGKPDGSPAWEQEHLGFCELDDLREQVGHLYYPNGTQRLDFFATRINPKTGGRGYGFACHKLCEQAFHELFRRWAELDLLRLLRTFDGSYNFRATRGRSSSLSPHSYGMAIDLDAQWNQFGWGPDRYEMHPDVAAVAEALGFTWGGRFSYPDAMHFQYGSY